MFKSATLKLTLWYVLLATGLSLLFSGVLYHFTTRELAEGLSHQYHVLIVNDHDGDNNNLPQQELDTHSRNLLSDLIYLNIAVVVGSSFISYALARRTLKPIEEAHQAQIRFTAEASHELRTPLTAMKADTETTLMEKSSDAVVLRHTLEGNLKDIEKLEQLANNLLEISRYQSKAVRHIEVIDLDSVLREELKQFQSNIQANDLHIKAQIAPMQVQGDLQGVRQLVTIVLDNAIKYSHDRAEIVIKLKRDGQYAVITIRDKGIGISAEDMPHIFEGFYRSQNAISKDKVISGYGLGLPLAKEIVETHKGSIEIQSMVGKGTDVVIRLHLYT
jgi:two-component system sensor histidine kinase CiaH